MSYYYNYYIGYMSKDKIYPLGPYSATGKLRPAVCKSSSFASDLHDDLYYVQDDMISDELREAFSYKNYNGEIVMDNVRYCMLSDLPDGNGITKGYFLIDDVKAYEEDRSADVFYDKLSPEVYAAMLKNELMFGKPAPEKDCEGEEYQPKSASDYMYYAYMDHNSKAYETFILRAFAEALGDYDSDLPKGYKVVILETEG